MLCVCGHDRASHRPVTLSVPIVNFNRKPYYLMGELRYANISYNNPRASYTQQQCDCGCGQFDLDDGL
jgi:hypothetical protein